MWPGDEPFPWTAVECKAAVLGYEVKWSGSFDDFLHHVRGRWEMSDGYGVLWQRDRVAAAERYCRLGLPSAGGARSGG